MTKMRRSISLFVVALSCILAATVGIPGHGVLGEGSSLARGAVGVQLMHNGVIALVSQTGGAGLAVINPDGTGLRRLTQPCTIRACILQEDVWSPDGRRIAFVRGPLHLCFNPRGCHQQPTDLSLFEVNANGTGEKRLARCGRNDCAGPSWSPDGTRIAFSRARSLYIVSASTGRVRALTRCSSTCFDIMPAWSPDGARIVFIRNYSVYIVNADGSGLRRLPQLGSASSPVWSPDGRSIAFDSRGEISTIHPDGSHLQVLTHFAGAPGSDPGNPVWSPDGRCIAFIRTPGHPGALTGELWVMDANGSNLRRVYRQDVPALAGPDWSPDGRYIAFLGYQKAPYRPWELLVMDANGSHLRLLKWPASKPEWQPVP